MILKINKLEKAFGGVKAVNKCSFEVKKNTITSLIGPNGAGKTTVFNLISGIIKPDKGSIRFHKEELVGKKPYQIAREGISRTFQLSRLFNNLTIKDNLKLAGAETDEEMDAALKLVHVKQPLTKLAGELSYGQQKLLEIARAMMHGQELLMLDEPTAGVNPKVRQELKVILRNIKQMGKTILLIEHDMDFVMDLSDEVVVLNEGKVLKVGKPKSVRRDPKVLEAYLGK